MSQTGDSDTGGGGIVDNGPEAGTREQVRFRMD